MEFPVRHAGHSMTQEPQALGRVHRQRWWWTAGKMLLVTFLYSKLLALALGLAISAAIWRA